jgi:hypothetical protein
MLFSRPDLHDVNIISEDGKHLSCHKCILTSRLDYFRSMFLADWMEVRTKKLLDCLMALLAHLESEQFRIENGHPGRST